VCVSVCLSVFVFIHFVIHLFDTYSCRLGLQLTIDQLEERVSSLNKWMVGLLIQYPDMLPEAKRLVVNFLQPIDPLILNVLNSESSAAAGGGNGNGNGNAGGSKRLSNSSSMDSEDEDTESTDRFDATKNKLKSSSAGTGTLTSFRDGQAAAPSRRGSVKGGTSVAGDISMYADVDAACVPVSIGEMLQSTVFLGSLAPKFVGDKKMHLSYQTVIAPTQIYFDNNRAAQSSSSNAKPAVMASISTLKVFDGYRQLYSRLTSLGIKQDTLGGVGFPPTYAQSALGVSLSKDQVQDRCQALNVWMGAVLRHSKEFSEEAKAVLREFFNVQAQDPLHAEMLKELGWAVPGITGVDAPADGSSSKTTEDARKASNDSTSATPATTANASAAATTTAPKRGSVLGIAGLSLGAEESKSAVEAAYSVGHDNPPTSIGPLQVLVTLGYLAGKSDNDKKLHQTYSVTMKLLTDPMATQSAQGAQGTPGATHSETSSANTHTVARAFDGYRKLQEELVRLGVSSDIEFPQTYSKSKLGMALSKDEVSDRVAVLNRSVLMIIVCLYVLYVCVCRSY
jgi:hypothetical protein